jgi:hypothetical protein
MYMTSVEVPKYQTVSSPARLNCNFDLGQDGLYSVKWYKDGSEFYRCGAISTGVHLVQ